MVNSLASSMTRTYQNLPIRTGSSSAGSVPKSIICRAARAVIPCACAQRDSRMRCTVAVTRLEYQISATAPTSRLT